MVVSHVAIISSLPEVFCFINLNYLEVVFNLLRFPDNAIFFFFLLSFRSYVFNFKILTSVILVYNFGASKVKSSVSLSFFFFFDFFVAYLVHELTSS